jgi:hypothetical protein
VKLRFGEMLDLTSGASDKDFELQRLRLEEIMQPGLRTSPVRLPIISIINKT